MQEDPELKNKSVSDKSVSPIQEPFTEGLYIVGLTREQIEAFGLFINDFYEKKRARYKSQQVTRNASTMIQGAIFALGTKALNNPEWKEHCASSLREIFHEWDDQGKIPSDFVLFYRNRGDGLTQEESDIFRDFRHHYKYFSGIDHHEASGIMSSLMALLKNNSLKLEDCYKDELFLARVKGFFLNLNDIFEMSKKLEKP